MSFSHKLQYYLLNYGQSQYLESLLGEVSNFDPDLVLCKVLDDGSPRYIQHEVASRVGRHQNIEVSLYPINRGTLFMVNECLRTSAGYYTYISGGDDASCPAALQRALSCLPDEADAPVVVSDFYVINVGKKSSVYVEAILPRRWMSGDQMSPEKVKELQKGEEMYIASHGALAPTNALRAAGGFPREMKWHCDWFSFHVAALRTGIRYIPAPLACWRQSDAGYSQSSRSAPKQQRKVLREILSNLIKSEYQDVRNTILSPSMTPLLEDINRQLVLAICLWPRYWQFLRWGHLKSALHEVAAPWISEDRWGGKLLKWLDTHKAARFLRVWRRPLIYLFLRLGGAQVGRKVWFGRKIAIRAPRGLKIGDNVTIGDGVSICAMHPLEIGSGTRIGNDVRLESANFSKKEGVRFLRKKSVCIGNNVVISSGCVIGPGANISSFARIPSNEHVENVESSPLFFLDETDQIRVDYDVLRERYGLDPRGVPVQHSETMT